jgi:hypothetical protein
VFTKAAVFALEVFSFQEKYPSAKVRTIIDSSMAILGPDWFKQIKAWLKFLTYAGSVSFKLELM